MPRPIPSSCSCCWRAPQARSPPPRKSMCNSLVPLLVLVLIPIVVLTIGAGLFDRPAVRSALIALAIGVLTLAPPRGGLDTASLDRIRLLLGGSLALFLTLRHLRVRWWAEARHW